MKVALDDVAQIAADDVEYYVVKIISILMIMTMTMKVGFYLGNYFFSKLSSSRYAF